MIILSTNLLKRIILDEDILGIIIPKYHAVSRHSSVFKFAIFTVGIVAKCIDNYLFNLLVAAGTPLLVNAVNRSNNKSL